MRRIEGTCSYVIECSGRSIDIIGDVLGIGEVYGPPLEVTSGWDDTMLYEKFTPEERAELADFAIARWQEWKTAT